MKKLVSLLIVMAMLATCLSVVAMATEVPVLSVSNASGNVGDTVEVAVSITEAEIANYTLELVYDSSALEIVEIKQGEATKATFLPNGNKAACMGFSNFTANGVLFTATFKILAAGNHTVSVSTQAPNVIGNQNGEVVDVTVVAGAVSVACTEGNHDIDWVEGTVTCTEDGLMEHYACSVCGKLFMDWEGTEEVTEDELFVKGGHQVSEEPNMIEDNFDGTFTLGYTCYLCWEVIRTEIVTAGSSMDVPLTVYPMECPKTTVEVPAGGSVFYQLGMFGGNYVVITGGDFTVNAIVSGMYGQGGSTTTYKSANGEVKFLDSGSRFSSTVIEIVNNGTSAATYTINLEIPMGAMENPETLYLGETTVTTVEGMQQYWVKWVADCNGTFTVTLTEPGEYWGFYIYNTTSYEQTDDHTWDGDGIMTDSVEFSIGDEIYVQFMNSYYDDEAGWVYPAGDITFEASVEYKHSIVHVEAKAPSCFEEGNIEYWYCSDCGYAWSDAECKYPTNLMAVKLPAACSEIIHVEAKAPSCFEPGNIEYWYCANEEHGTVWIDEDLMQISNHMSVKLAPACQDVIHIEGVEPACHYEGVLEHWYCNNPEHGTVWLDEDRTVVSNHKSVILPALGGDVVHVEAADPTCTEYGHVEYWYCEECEQVWADEALTQLTNRKNVITDAPNGHEYDDDEDMICNVCEFDRTNSQTGDFGIVAAVAAAVISMTGVVALPVAKKKFF